MVTDDVLTEPAAISEQIRSLVADAEEEVTLSLPEDAVSDLGDVLADAVDRDMLVLILLSDMFGAEGQLSTQALADRSTVARRTSDVVPVFCCVDNERGLIGESGSLTEGVDDTDGAATFAFPHVAGALYRDFITNFWMVSTEVYAAPAPDLPGTYDGIRHAVTRVALCLRDEVPVRCRAEGIDPDTGDSTTVEGRVLNVHQRMVYPASSSLPVENSILVDGDGRQWIGGPYAVLEDVAAERVRLMEA